MKDLKDVYILSVCIEGRTFHITDIESELKANMSYFDRNRTDKNVYLTIAIGTMSEMAEYAEKLHREKFDER